VEIESTLKRYLTLAVVAACFTISACSQKEEEGKGRRGTPTVGFVVAQTSDVGVPAELSGRIVAFEASEVRPQIAGIVRRRMFTEGSYVRAGQALYQIDPQIYRAAANEAAANLASAQATAGAARARADRYRPLAQIEAISKQDLDDAQAQARAANASVAQMRARLDTAQINLRFTTVTAPISGHIGRSLVTEGALVTDSQASPLALIQRTDPVYVDIQQSAANLLAMRRMLASGAASPGSTTIHLILEDGSDYGLTGRIAFAEAVTNEQTGTVTLRATVPNPNGLLIPGMFVRAKFEQFIDRGAILVPQVALSRDANGDAMVWVVGADNKVQQRKVTADRTQGDQWIVTAGLEAGDKIVTQGASNLQPGMAVRAVPASTPQRIAPPGAQGNAAASSGQAARSTAR
jgi:membrane fusion protein (multidrug efflux system)